MKKIVRLTESDLVNIVRRVMNEAPSAVSLGAVTVGGSSITGVYAPGEVISGKGDIYNFSDRTNATVFSVTHTPTADGKKLGLTPDMLKIKLPATVPFITDRNRDRSGTKVRYPRQTGNPTDQYTIGSYTYTFKAPTAKFTNTTGKYLKLFDLVFNTNDSNTPDQTAGFFVGNNSQFGVSGAQTPVSKN